MRTVSHKGFSKCSCGLFFCPLNKPFCAVLHFLHISGLVDLRGGVLLFPNERTYSFSNRATRWNRQPKGTNAGTKVGQRTKGRESSVEQRINMSMKWFKFYGQDFLSDMKMGQLTIPERLMWVTILCLAHEEDRGGNIRYCTEELLKSKMGIKENDPEWNDLNGVFSVFTKLDMIEETDNGIFVKNFQKRQETNLIPAEKMARYRAKKKGNEPITSTVTKVTSNRLEKIREDKTLIKRPSNDGLSEKPAITEKTRHIKSEIDRLTHRTP